MSGGGICSCEDARWIEVAQNRRCFVLAMSKFTVILQQSSLVSKMDIVINVKNKLNAMHV